MKSTLPSLKPLVPKPLRSHLVYQIECPGCQASYVGYTKLHISARLREHRNVKAPVGKHFANCVGIKPKDSANYNKVREISAGPGGTAHQ